MRVMNLADVDTTTHIPLARLTPRDLLRVTRETFDSRLVQHAFIRRREIRRDMQEAKSRWMREQQAIAEYMQQQAQTVGALTVVASASDPNAFECACPACQAKRQNPGPRRLDG